MQVLEKIITAKKAEIINQKKVFSLEKLQKMPLFNRETVSLKERLLDSGSSGIIAEFKQKSPSKGIINELAKVEVVTKGYAGAGVAGLSVLTDYEFFGGTLANLLKARETNPGIPVLRKDFIIDPYQIYEAKAYGADVILLIAACLGKTQLHGLALLAKQLGLEVLVEVHNEEELEKISPAADLAGVNNRNLKTFKVGIETSERLGPLIPEPFVKIAESGIVSPENIFRLREAGFKGFLIGESFMKTADPAKTCKDFISELGKCKTN